MYRSLVLAALAAVSLSSAACTHAELTPPASFASVDGGDAYDYRATTPQGVVVAVRREANDPRADVDFWARAVDLRLQRDGYARASEAKVRTDRGLDGVELTYARAADGRTYRYVVAVFTKDSGALFWQKHRLYVVEAGGDAEAFDPKRAEVEKAIRSLDD